MLLFCQSCVYTVCINRLCSQDTKYSRECCLMVWKDGLHNSKSFYLCVGVDLGWYDQEKSIVINLKNLYSEEPCSSLLQVAAQGVYTFTKPTFLCNLCSICRILMCINKQMWCLKQTTVNKYMHACVQSILWSLALDTWQQKQSGPPADSPSGSILGMLAQPTMLILGLNRLPAVFDIGQKHLDHAYPGSGSPFRSKGLTGDTLWQ